MCIINQNNKEVEVQLTVMRLDGWTMYVTYVYISLGSRHSGTHTDQAAEANWYEHSWGAEVGGLAGQDTFDV